MRRDMQLGFLSHLAAVGLLCVALLIPPSKLTHNKLALAFLPAIWALHIYSWSVGLGFLAALQVLWATELLLFRNPREKFQIIYHRHQNSISSSPPLKKKVDTDKSTQKREEGEKAGEKDPQNPIWKEPYPSSFWKRLSWVFKLHVSTRYIGWDIGDGSSYKPPVDSLLRERKSRIRWLLKNILFVGFFFCLIDATNLYQHFDPYFQVDTKIDAPFPLPLTAFLAHYGLGSLPPRIVRITVLGGQQYAVFTVVHRVLAIIHVSLGGVGLLDDWWGGMENWPSLMGSPLVVWENGLRGFWGRGWHQLFRNLLTSPAKAMLRVIGLPPKSLSAYIIKIVVAFLLSGVIHAASLPHNIPGVSPLRYASFFWIQGACVLGEVIFEHALQGLGRLKPKARWMRWGWGLGRLGWTVGMFYLTIPVIADELTAVTRVLGLRPVVLFPFPKL